MRHFVIVSLIYWIDFKLMLSSRECTNLEFQCDDGECIPKQSWCTHCYSSVCLHKTCRDRSSERNCGRKYPWCGEDQKSCDKGKRACFPKRWICDGYKDCDDGSDEQGCLERELRLQDMEEMTKIRTDAESWMLNSHRANWGWGEDTNRAITALYLANPEVFSTGNITSGMMVKQLHIQLLDLILRNSSTCFPTHKMALYVHALRATCSNPLNFHGYDLVEILENRFQNSDSANPFIALVLCNENSKIPLERIQELANVDKEPNTAKWIDSKALALLAMFCMRNRPKVYGILSTDYIESMDNITRSLKNSLKHTGNFGNIYTTALITQALLGTTTLQQRNLTKGALQYLASQQKPDGSFGDVVSTYFVLPLLYGRTLLDLGVVKCSSNFSESQSNTMKEELDSRHTTKKTVEYNIWKEEDKEISFGMTMKVPESATFYEIMLLAKDLDPRFEFEYDEQLSYIYFLFGTASDPEGGKYWKLYLVTANGTEPVHEPVKERVPEDGENYVFWYKG